MVLTPKQRAAKVIAFLKEQQSFHRSVLDSFLDNHFRLQMNRLTSKGDRAVIAFLSKRYMAREIIEAASSEINTIKQYVKQRDRVDKQPRHKR